MTTPAPPPAPPSATAAAEEYGQKAARLPEWLPRSWDELAPQLERGWASRHREVCGCAEDWRLSFPAVEAGWRSVREAP